MKKIYMILAAITLLSMSLNAQTTYEKVTSESQLVVGNNYILVCEDANTAMTSTASNSRLNGESVTISNNTVTLGSNSNVAVLKLGGSMNSYTLESGGKYLSGAKNSTNLTLASSVGTYSTWRLNDNNGALSGYRAVNSEQTSRAVLYRTSATQFADYATSNIGSNSDYSYAFLYVEVSTNPVITASPNSVSMNSIPGTSVTETVSVTGLNLTDDITATISGADASLFGVNPTSLGTSGGSLTVIYTPSATGTHTATLTLSSTGAPDVTITLNGTCTQDVTVCDGSETSSYLPVYGSWYDSETGQKNQMIYNASLLTSLVGKSITSMTFYAPYGISFSGGSVTYSLGTTSTNAFSSATALTDNVTAVATVVPNGETEWTITFSSPYPYNGGNLLIQVDTQTGSYSNTSFTGMDMSSDVGYYSYTGYSGVSNNLTQILPKVTFTYEDNDTPALTAPANGDEINVGENNGAGVDKTVTVSGRNLTEDLTVSVTGTGFNVSPTTLTAAQVNDGTTVTVTYQGTDPNATGTLTITSGDTGVNPVTVNLTATYVDITPVLTAPTTGTTVNVGTNEGAGVSTNVTVSGNYLTEALNVSVTGDGFSVSPSSISAADANAGATVTVTYNGTDPNATGTLTIGSNEVNVTVNLTASYVYHAPELTAPTNNSTVNVGTNTGNGVSKAISVSGNYLTQDLTVSVSGDGFTVSRDAIISAADANAGTTVTVTYNGTNPNATGTLTINSSEVSATVNLTASYSDNGEITVANGTTTDMYLPVYGSYYEEVQMNQMIYPASMLTDMEGKFITSITFYPASVTQGSNTYSGIRFNGGKVMLSLGSTTNNSFTSNAAISATVSPVAEITNVVQDFNQTAWTFTFDTPYFYEGGNLLLQVDTEAGEYNRTYFYGSALSNMGRHQCSSSNDRHNFLPKATFTYSSTAPLPPAVEGGLLRLHLLFCDQLKANIPDDNSHPDAYGYVLRWEPQGEDMKESGRVKVNIQKTDCEVLSAYTLDQIDLDKHIGAYDETTGTIKHDQGLTMDVITAQVEFDLSSSNDMLNYYYLQGKEAGYPSPDEFLSQLHRQENFTYREMWPDAPEFDKVYESGDHHYFDPDLKTGVYGSNTRFMSYAPSVTTWGIQRRYFELDGKDNTYGAPVWKTSVGKVRMQGTPVAERQSNANNSVNWTDENGAAASIYVLDNIEAVGNLPHTDKTKVKFEPYMFRVFVESENGLLRNYNVVGEDPNNTTQPGEHIEGATTSDDDSRGPLCIWSGYVKYDEQTGLPTNDPENGVELTITQDPLDNTQQIYTFHKNKVAGGHSSENWKEHNAVFGALDALSIAGYNDNGQPILQSGINEKDLRVFVRFYYNVEGRADGHVIMGRAADADRPGNGSESPGTAPSPWTAVKEISYNGEVVSVTYVNSLGMQSDEPFEGVNIVVTRYSDGKISTTKVLR